ncbi:MAG TPA: hypothetical protein VK752_05325 [Bryobacteraceae bacterium]|jgi:hypothetical protein|nr:hypothetical protein [Bryobacteraceae bacterium]
MKHWDLRPGETVTLRTNGGALRRTARFLFRDTKIAAFQMDDGRYREFNLRQSGSLRDRADVAEILGATVGSLYVSVSEIRDAIYHSRVWTIEGEDRHTRGRAIGGSEPVEARRAFAARMAE